MQFLCISFSFLSSKGKRQPIGIVRIGPNVWRNRVGNADEVDGLV